MKNFLKLFILILITSCNSDDSEAIAQKSLQGKWKWVQSSGGIAGMTYTPESTKQTIYIEFSGSSFKTYTNGKLSSDNAFVIKTEKSIFGDDRPMIVSSNLSKSFVAMSFTIDGNKLYLSEECYDCFGSSYVHIE